MRFPFTLPRRRRPALSPAAFEAEALLLIDQLWAAALRLTHRQPDAEDLVYRTYVEAFRSTDRVPSGTTMKTWLFTVLHDAYRQTGGTISLDSSDEDAGLTDLAAVASDSTDSVAQHQRGTASYEEVKAALDSLPDPLRQILYLRDVEDFTHDEIARMLHLPAGPVLTRLGRGRRLLVQRLERSWERTGIRVVAMPAL